MAASSIHRLNSSIGMIMRAVFIAVFVLVTASGLTGAFAQRSGTQQNAPQNSGDNARKAQIDAEEKVAKEKAYQDAIRRIPASTEKQDPWKNAR